MPIILECVREGRSKLRIRFHSYIDEQENRVYTNVYNNTYNCTFPKDIRIEGRLYQVPDTDIRLIHVEGSDKKPFYGIKRSNIQIVTDVVGTTTTTTTSTATATTSAAMPRRVFDAVECVICLSEPSICIYVPCGHQCVGVGCNTGLKSSRNYSCNVCREKIKSVIIAG